MLFLIIFGVVGAMTKVSPIDKGPAVSDGDASLTNGKNFQSNDDDKEGGTRECTELRPSWPPPEMSADSEHSNKHFLTALDATRLLDAVATTRGVLDQPKLAQLLKRREMDNKDNGTSLVQMIESDAHHIPRAMREFDWRLGFDPETDDAAAKSPTSVFLKLDPESHDEAQKLVQTCKDSGGLKESIIVLGGGVPLSKARPWLKKLMSACQFKKTYYEGVDVRMEGVNALPSGLNEMFVGMAGEETVMKTIKAATLGTKPRGILAATNYLSRGRRTTHSHSLSAWIKKTCWAPRSEPLAPREYWTRLAASRFVFVPFEKRPQNTKMYEALLVLTIPICERTVAVEQLQETGFPVVIVDDWEEVTPESLKSWYAQLAPKLVPFRERLLTERWYHDLVGSDEVGEALPTANPAAHMRVAVTAAAVPERVLTDIPRRLAERVITSEAVVTPAGSVATRAAVNQGSGLGRKALHCEEAPKGLFVMGVPMSGTTLTTGLIEALGTTLGPVQGHDLELPEVSRLNDAIYLQDHGRKALPTWWTRGVLPPWSMKHTTGDSPTLVKSAEEILNTYVSEKAHCGPWLVKAPAFSSTFPVWANAAQNLGLPFAVLMVSREPLSNAAALQTAMAKLNPRHQRDALQAWELQNGLMMRQTKEFPRFHIHYTDLVSPDRREGVIATLVDDLQSFGMKLEYPEGGYAELMKKVQITPHPGEKAAPKGTKVEECPSTESCYHWTLSETQANLATTLREWGPMEQKLEV